MHLGSLVSAVASYLDARHNHGQWLIRMEDIDPPRESQGAAEEILAALEALELHSDQPILLQSTRLDAYEDALARLADAGHLYYCQCSRREIRERLKDSGDDIAAYDGWCRERGLAEGAIRVRTSTKPILVHDRYQGPLTENLAERVGDFIVKRKDGLIAYQLACVVDDEYQGITDIVRGDDLWDNCARQRWLQHLLGFRKPRYLHLPVVRDARGIKLSKQYGAAAASYDNPLENIGYLLKILGFSSFMIGETRSITAMLQQASNAWNPHDAALAIHRFNSSVATQQIELL